MDYKTIYTKDEIRNYIAGANVVAFDFETAPDDGWRGEPKAALDAHKAHIVGVSLSVSEGSAVYIPLAHRSGNYAADPDGTLKNMREAVFEKSRVARRRITSPSRRCSFTRWESCLRTLLRYHRGGEADPQNQFEFRSLSDSGLKLLAESLFGRICGLSAVTADGHFDELNPQSRIRELCLRRQRFHAAVSQVQHWFDKNPAGHRTLRSGSSRPRRSTAA
jgi:DNA polymerase-1